MSKKSRIKKITNKKCDRKKYWIKLIIIVLIIFILFSIGSLIGFNRTSGVSNPITLSELYERFPAILIMSLLIGFIVMTRKEMR